MLVLQEACQPCAIKYDFIAKLETLNGDLELLLPKINATFLVGHFPGSNSERKEKRKMYNYFTRNVTRSLLEAIKVKYKYDAELFGYDMDKYDDLVINNL